MTGRSLAFYRQGGYPNYLESLHYPKYRRLPVSGGLPKPDDNSSLAADAQTVTDPFSYPDSSEMPQRRYVSCCYR
jgi:hypothetical protein